MLAHRNAHLISLVLFEVVVPSSTSGGPVNNGRGVVGRFGSAIPAPSLMWCYSGRGIITAGSLNEGAASVAPSPYL